MSSPRRALPATSCLIFPATSALLLLTGCGTGTLAPPSPVAIPALHGHVKGGQQPLTGTVIKLYAVGSLGNGSPATDLLGTGSNGPATSVSSGSDGSFNITGDYTCPVLAPSTPVYLTATGGNPGLISGTDNTAIALVAALGPCDQLLANAATTYITINEATTAAAAWALSPFATSLTAIGATPTNLAGITQAFTIANQLVDTSQGTSPNASVASFATIEFAKLYSLADVLSSCVNSTGTTTDCSGLFTDVTPSGTKPSDTFAAALEVVKNPGYNVSDIFTKHISTSPPFPPLTSAPHDWTMTISYVSFSGYSTSTGPLSSFLMGGIDSSGNLVGTASSGNNLTLASFNPQFTQLLNVPICPDGNGYCYGASTLDNGFAIDSAGDLWIDTVYVENNPDPTAGSDVGPFTVSEFSSTGTLLSPIAGEPVGSVASSGAAQAQAIAADSNGTVWVGNFGDSGGNVALLNNNGTLLSPTAGYGSSSGISPINIALDGNHNAWIASWGYANEAGKSVSYPYITSIAVGLSSPATPTITKYAIDAPVTYAIAVDPSNNVWFTSGSSQSAGFNNLGYIKSTGMVGATAVQTGGMVNGVSLATDPGNHVWVANSNPTSLILSLSEFSTATGSTGSALSPSTGLGLDTGLATAYVIENIPGLIIDASGCLWLPNTYVDQPGQEYFNTNYPRITVFVGLATPTKTPLLGPPQAP
jgi:hypothetical protein